MSDAEVVANDARAGESRRGQAGWNAPAMRIIAGLAARFATGRLHVIAPDGTSRWFGAGNGAFEATLIVRRPRAVYRFLKGGALGFAEAYIDGDVDTPDLAALLRLFLVNHDALAERWQAKPAARLWRRLWHRLRPNSKRGSRRNIHAHYDLGNAFYGLWLDPTMTYSSALFDEDDDLEAAQRRKYRRLCQRLELAPGMHVLEVGCGWGGFAVTAAQEFGCRVKAITISEAQLAHARQRVADAGLADQIDVRLVDYRDLDGRYDAIASIEMFEAVGEAYWPTYFSTLARVLKSGGRCGLQVITIDDRYFDDYRTSVDFIQRYVFPGGMLPSPRALAEAAAAQGLDVVDRLAFGADYARTLRLWAERFHARWAQIEPLGFDERFRRLWGYYLAYCETGFRVGSIDVEQVVFRHAR